MKRLKELYIKARTFIGETPWGLPASVLLINGLYLCIMSLYRFVFMLWFSDFSDFSGLYGDLFEAFILGIRFDFQTVCYANYPVVITAIVLFFLNREKPIRIFKTVLIVYYPLLFGLIFTLNFVDFGFYSYFKDHTNTLIFGFFEDDTIALLSTIWENFNVPILTTVLLIFFAFVFAVSFFILRNVKQFNPPLLKTWQKVLISLGLIICVGLGARGTLSMYPLGMMNTDISPNLFLCKLGPNGTFYFYEALKTRNQNADIAKELGYGKNVKQAFADFTGIAANRLKKPLADNLIRTVPVSDTVHPKPHVILIMMESFGYDLLRYQSESFNVLGELDKHFKHDIVFRRFISSSVGTISNLESVLLNIPKRPGTRPVSQSEFSSRNFPSGCAVPFKANGYTTTFISSGSPGWRNLHTFIPNTGFESIEGWRDMPSEYKRNQWGVFDEYLFSYIHNKLKQNPDSPQFIFGLTTTNHPPYSVSPDYKPLPLEIPEKLKKRIRNRGDLTQARLISYQYANSKLGEFITKIKNSELGKHTIIAVTSDDNTVELFNYTSSQFLDRYRIPFYIYLPERYRPLTWNPDVPGSHADVMPTLYNRALPGTEYISLGTDLFTAPTSRPVSNSHGLVLGRQGAIEIKKRKIFKSHRWADSMRTLLEPVHELDEQELLLRYYRSVYSVGDYLIKNSEVRNQKSEASE